MTVDEDMWMHEFDVTGELAASVEMLMNATAAPETHSMRLRDRQARRFQRFRVQRVVRVENARLWRDYANERASMLVRWRAGADLGDHGSLAQRLQTTQTAPASLHAGHLLSAEANEAFLFHGVPSVNIAGLIRQTGFEETIARSDGNMFGKGIYFAER